MVDVCIVGGGPAGMMLALMLARRGVRVELLEMHKDFDRDFRGDTVHPSTLNLLDQLNLADELLTLPHGRISNLKIVTPEQTFEPINLASLGGKYPYTAIMPQVSFLNFLHEQASAHPTYRCALGHAVQALEIDQSGRVNGVRCKTADGERTVLARVVIGADGRFSRLRKLAALEAQRRAPPMDVCWFRVPRETSDTVDAGAFYVNHGQMLVCIPRPESWQLGYVFPKGDFAAVKSEGFEAFKTALRDTAPWLGSRVHTLEGFGDLHLLRIESDCLTTWHVPGMLLIGDAAHTMSPVGGVGINAAIADAVAAANIIGPELLSGADITAETLARVQQARGRITRIIQTAQAGIQSVIVQRALQNKPFELPLIAKVVTRTPGLRNLPARIFAIGVRQPVLNF